ncbi:hypothetical protein [Cyclonatronum proteinivorum]|uniref:hypothetical protein n=1 Tax=Cyclonatronum proteinivorum TaxID=1457365 RepID=UPI000F533692|nr:hypothetical protein [Cyclonatronum proteinivorum]
MAHQDTIYPTKRPDVLAGLMSLYFIRPFLQKDRIICNLLIVAICFKYCPLQGKSARYWISDYGLFPAFLQDFGLSLQSGRPEPQEHF